MSTLDLAHSWHRADFILRGEYCPLRTLHEEFDKIRIRLGARFLIHIAVDHEVILRSLNWACGDPEPLSRRLAQTLRQANYRDAFPELNTVIVKMVQRESAKLVARVPTNVAGNIVEQLAHIVATTYGAQAPSLLPLHQFSWTGLMLNHGGREPFTPRDGEVRSVLLYSPASPSSVGVHNADFQDLSVMIKCTFEANARRDAVVMNQVADELSVHEVEQYHFSELAAKALALAIKITRSDAGAVYLLSAEEPIHLQCEARTPSNIAYEKRMPFDNEMFIAQSIIRHRAYQYVGYRHGPVNNLKPTIDSDSGIELITPISGPLADTKEPAIGAVTLHRSARPQGYSSYERALVRNVALRLALMHTGVATREIATAISILRSTSPTSLTIQPKAKGDLAKASRLSQWPSDVNIAIPKLRKIFRQLATSTQSHSISLRIALPDPSVNEPGLVLARVAAYPLARIDDSFALQKITDPGPHWDVMRIGEPINIRDVNRQQEYPRFRPNTLSALCVPVRAEGIVIGTLNLESPLIDNYDPFMSLIVALCGAIGRTLADGRAALETSVLDNAAQALARRHEFSGDLTALAKDVKNLTEGSSKEPILARIASMHSAIKDLRDLPGRQSASASYWGIISEVAQAAQLRFGAISKPTDDIFHQKVSSQATQLLSTVLRSLFRNINFHSDISAHDSFGRPVPRAHFSVTKLQGTAQAVATFENFSRDFLEPDVCKQLYRYPITGPGGELRLGTYIAGLNARRMGARIHACCLEDKKTFRTTLIVPIGDLT